MARKRRVSTAVDRISPLPEELLVEILLRVPADGLVQLRHVSKCCREVINRPSFARTHLSRWRSLSGLAYCYSSKIFYVSFDDVGGDEQCSKASRHELRVDCRELRDRLLCHCREWFDCCWLDLKLLDSCDGLLLIWGILMGNCGRQTLMVCNPATRRCRLFPNCDKMLRFRPRIDPNCWKIVYDPSVRSYKVIGVSTENSLICIIAMDPARQPATSWKEIRVSPSLVGVIIGESLLVNGKLHLLLDRLVRSSWISQLLSIDLATEEGSCFRFVPNEHCAVPSVWQEWSVLPCGDLPARQQFRAVGAQGLRQPGLAKVPGNHRHASASFG